MNSVVLSGHLTRDIVVSKSASGMSIVRFSIGVNRESKEDASDFPNCIAFDKTADYLGSYGTKGRLIELKGRLQTGSYVNREGQKVYTTDVIVDRCRFLDRRDAKPADAGTNDQEPDEVPTDIISDDDLPF